MGGAQVTGSSTSLQKRGSDHTTWSYDWGGAGVQANAPVPASWITQYAGVRFSENQKMGRHDMNQTHETAGGRRGRGRWIPVATVASLAAGAALLLGATGVARQNAVRAVAAPSPEEIATIRGYALELARQNDEASPREGRLVATSERVSVAAVSGAELADHRDVYLVTMRGAFVGHRASRFGRPTPPPPRGSVLVAAFEKGSLDLVYWGITNRLPALANLGQPLSLDLPAAARRPWRLGKRSAESRRLPRRPRSRVSSRLTTNALWERDVAWHPGRPRPYGGCAARPRSQSGGAATISTASACGRPRALGG